MSGPHLLVHYHLRPGGVTTVVREQARILTNLGQPVIIISGEAPPAESEPWPVPVQVIPELAYRAQPLPQQSLESAVQQLGDMAGPQGILHFHNPTLGKNPSWMPMVNRLASGGQALLLQIHDFGEDGRWPAGGEPMDHATCYPRGERIRWLVLHPDDRALLLASGLEENEVALLPNPVSVPGYGTLPRARDGKFRVLYPARGIRRKNLGEFLLLAALAPSSWELRITLPPIGAAQERHFRRWVKWREKLGIRALLGMGTGDVRPDLVISTSVLEGFGYSFAEPWLADVPATGRYPGRWLVAPDGEPLPHAPGLYRAIHIPVRWIRGHVVQRAIANTLPGQRERLLVEKKFRNGRIDFADLPESEQRHVLRRILEDPEAARREIFFESTDGRSISAPVWFSEIAAHSRGPFHDMAERMRSAFSPDRMGETLRAVASRAREARGGLRGHADASMVPRIFSEPGNFRFLRLPPT